MIRHFPHLAWILWTSITFILSLEEYLISYASIHFSYKDCLKKLFHRICSYGWFTISLIDPKILFSSDFILLWKARIKHYLLVSFLPLNNDYPHVYILATAVCFIFSYCFLFYCLQILTMWCLLFRKFQMKW